MTGVACPAGHLVASMAVDGRGRPLHVFVGWTALVDDVTPPLPTLPEWASHYVDWAVSVYEDRVRPD